MNGISRSKAALLGRSRQLQPFQWNNTDLHLRARKWLTSFSAVPEEVLCFLLRMRAILSHEPNFRQLSLLASNNGVYCFSLWDLNIAILGVDRLE